MTNADWRHHLFFSPRPEASGLAYFYGFGGSVNNFYTGTGGDAGSPTTTAVMYPGIVLGRQYRYYIQTVYNEGVTLNAAATLTAGRLEPSAFEAGVGAFRDCHPLPSSI